MLRPIATLAPLLCALAGCAAGRDGYAYLPPLVPPVYPQPQDRKATRPPVQPVGQPLTQPVPPTGFLNAPPFGAVWPAPFVQPQPALPPLGPSTAGPPPPGVIPGPAVLTPQDCPR